MHWAVHRHTVDKEMSYTERIVSLYLNADVYAKPIEIKGTQYRMCCEWFEKRGAYNDRPYLLKWIEEHKNKCEVLRWI